jgi:hypothetical protein
VTRDTTAPAEPVTSGVSSANSALALEVGHSDALGQGERPPRRWRSQPAYFDDAVWFHLAEAGLADVGSVTEGQDNEEE